MFRNSTGNSVVEYSADNREVACSSHAPWTSKLAVGMFLLGATLKIAGVLLLIIYGG